MSEIHKAWCKGDIELIKEILHSMNYWEVDVFLLAIKHSNPITIKNIDHIQEFKKIQNKKFKQLSFDDKVRAISLKLYIKFKNIFSYE